MNKALLNKKAVFLSLVVICIAGFLAYFNSFGNEFVWDDDVLIVNNPFVKSFNSLPEVFSKGLFQAPGAGKGSYWRPLQVVTYMLDYKIWKFNPLGYHVTNLAIHILCAVLFFFIVAALAGEVKPALIAALLFVVHPVHTQAVTYISGRADILCVFFMLLSFLCFTAFLGKKGRVAGLFYAACFISFLGAIFSKEIAVVFPLFFLLYMYIFGSRIPALTSRKKILYILPFFVTVAAYAVLRMTVLNFFEGTFLSQTPLYLRLLTAVKNIFAYIGLLAAPFGLHIERRVEFVSSFFNPKVIASFLALIFIAGIMYKIRRRKVLLFFSAWFFLGLLPVFNIFPLNATLAEHWVYLPSMGLFALAGVGISKLLDISDANAGPVLKALLIISLAAVIGIYNFATVKRNSQWRDLLSLSLSTVKYVPDNYKVRNNLGKAYAEKGMFDRAFEEFKKSVELQPLYAYSHANLGFIYAYKGRHAQAVSEYEQALKLNPGLEKAYIGLGGSYVKLNEFKQALRVYKQGIERFPDNADMHSQLGLLLAQAGRKQEAVFHGKKSIELAPYEAMLHYNMGVIYEYNDKGIRCGQGFDLEKAKSEYLRAIELDKNYKTAYYNLAVLLEYNSQGERYGEGFDFKAAQRYYLKVLELDPEYTWAKDNLEYLRSKFKD